MKKVILLILTLSLVVCMTIQVHAMSPNMTYEYDEGPYVNASVSDEYSCRTGASFSNATCVMNYSRRIVLSCSLDIKVEYSVNFYHKDIDDSTQGKSLTVTGSNKISLIQGGELTPVYGSIDSAEATYSFGQYFSKHHVID